MYTHAYTHLLGGVEWSSNELLRWGHLETPFFSIPSSPPMYTLVYSSSLSTPGSEKELTQWIGSLRPFRKVPEGLCFFYPFVSSPSTKGEMAQILYLIAFQPQGSGEETWVGPNSFYLSVKERALFDWSFWIAKTLFFFFFNFRTENPNRIYQPCPCLIRGLL